MVSLVTGWQEVVKVVSSELYLDWRGLRMFASTGDRPEEPLRYKWRGWETRADLLQEWVRFSDRAW